MFKCPQSGPKTAHSVGSGEGRTVRYTHIADPMRAAVIDVHPINAWLQPQGA